MTPQQLQREILADLGRFSHDPYGFVMWAFPWGEPDTSLANETGPDDWQREQLQAIGRSLQADPFKVIQDATASGHGVGKSSEVAWLILWAIMTFEDTRGVVTANTDTQLRTKTWPELQKWYGLLRFELLRRMFTVEATSIHSTLPGHDRTWRIDAIPWSAQNTEAFAGLHNAGKRVIYLFDEGSAIIDPIYDVASGGLTDAGTELLWIVYGNPTRNSGRFKEAIEGRHRHLWTSRQIDSRTVKRTNKAQIQSYVDTYGEDSDFVRVRVRGLFPRAGTLQLIGLDLVQEARKRLVEALPTDPLIFGLDIARFGDDASVLAKRCGRDARSRPWKRWREVDTMTLAGDVALEAMRERPDAIFVDIGAMGAGVVDRLRQLMGHDAPIFEVNFGGKGREVVLPGNVRVKTANKRAEMWCALKAWLSGGGIPDDQQLEADLTGPEYGYGPDQVSIQLERKRDMKARGLASPDDGDALALTFAEPVMPRLLPSYLRPARGQPPEADLYADLYQQRG